ncbi:MAG: acyltransferase family protein [Chloroflexota bacterium]
MSGSARLDHPRASAWRPRATVDAAAGAGAGPGRAAAGSDGFRADIQGLRAVAVLLVLAFHLWPESLTGGFVGVDVFFVISGFLITAHLLQHPPRGSRDLLEFWGRRIRRLLPAAFLVLFATAIATRVLAPETRWAANAGETIAAGLYVENWLLAGNAVNYLSAEEPPTPVQHYWSLSVEEQFYLLWPILILAIFWLASRARTAPLRVTRLGMLATIGISLFISVTATAAEPASAYFITPTRIWELAAGGLVATLPALPVFRLPTRIVDGVAWTGLAMIVIAGFAFSGDTAFPGFAAVLPVGGTALVIFAAATGAGSPTRLLRLRPIQHLGDVSYSIYLWHWPLIVFWAYVAGTLGLVDQLLIIATTIVLATITKVLVEDTFRFQRSLQPLVPTFRFAVLGMVLVALLGGAQLFEAQQRLNAAVAAAPGGVGDPGIGEEPGLDQEPAFTPDPTLAPGATPGPTPTDPPPDPTFGPDTCIGAAAIVRGFDACPQDPAARMVPQPLAAARDMSAAYRDGCWIYSPFATRITCKYGKGPLRIALVGNSHAGHWLPMLQVLAKRNGWQVTTFLASRCNATDASLELYSGTAGCLAYGRWVMGQTSGDTFDLVVTSERQSVKTSGDSWSATLPAAVAGYAAYLKRWSDAGTNVLVLEDTPFPGKVLGTVPDCLARHTRNQDACNGTPKSWAWLDPLYVAATDAVLPGITPVATRRFFCTETICPAVIGTIVGYFDGSHITATYGRSIAPFLEGEILAALARGGSN